MNVCLYIHVPSHTQTYTDNQNKDPGLRKMCLRWKASCCKSCTCEIAVAGCRDRKLPAMATPSHEECRPGLLSCLGQMDSGQNPPWACEIPHQEYMCLATTLLGHVGILSPPHSPGPRGDARGTMGARGKSHVLGRNAPGWWVLSDATGKSGDPRPWSTPCSLQALCSSTNTGCPAVHLFICAARPARVGEGFLGLLSLRTLS